MAIVGLDIKDYGDIPLNTASTTANANDDGKLLDFYTHKYKLVRSGFGARNEFHVGSACQKVNLKTIEIFHTSESSSEKCRMHSLRLQSQRLR